MTTALAVEAGISSSYYKHMTQQKAEATTTALAVEADFSRSNKDTQYIADKHAGTVQLLYWEQSQTPGRGKATGGGSTHPIGVQGDMAAQSKT